jgi:hypothetical protein
MPRNITAATDSILHINLMPVYGECSLYLHQVKEEKMRYVAHTVEIGAYRICRRT